MRKILHLWLLAALLLSEVQGITQVNEPLPIFFFGRLPSARAEALGKGYTAIEGDLACVHFNPAGMARIKQIELNVAQSPPSHYLVKKGIYSFYAGGWRINRYLQVGLSQFMFNYGRDPQISGQLITPYVQRNTLTLSSQPLRNLSVGVNINYLVYQPGNGDRANKPLFIDVGLLKQIPFPSIHSSLNIGSSLTNINKGFIRVSSSLATIKNEIPMIWRSALSYQWAYGRCFLLDTLPVVKLLGLVEWQQLVNSSYRKAIRSGVEVQLYNMLSFRCGYYYETVYDFGFPAANNNVLESFTYGFGLQVPLHLFTRLPVSIKMDYARLPQVPYSRIFTEYPKFTSYTVGLNYAVTRRRR